MDHRPSCPGSSLRLILPHKDASEPRASRAAPQISAGSWSQRVTPLPGRSAAEAARNTTPSLQLRTGEIYSRAQEQRAAAGAASDTARPRLLQQEGGQGAREGARPRPDVRLPLPGVQTAPCTRCPAPCPSCAGLLGGAFRSARAGSLTGIVFPKWLGDSGANMGSSPPSQVRWGQMAGRQRGQGRPVPRWEGQESHPS